MYNKIISVIMLVIMLMMLASCGKNENTPQEDETPGPEPGETISLEVVFNEVGKTIMNYGGGNERGFYDVIPRVWNIGEQISTGEFDNNIVYTDYETKNRVYLCNDPACKHDSESCTSYIKSSSNAAVFPIGENLICFRFGKTNGTASKEEDLCAVIVMDLNGSYRRTLYTLDPKEAFSQPLIVLADDKRIYFQISSLDENNNINKNVVSLNIETGEKKDVTKISTVYMLVSAYDDCMLFYDTGTQTNMIYSLSDNSMTEGLAGVSGVYKGSLSIDLEYDVERGDYQKIFQAKNLTVVISDMKDGSVRRFGPYPMEDDHGPAGLTDVYDKHVCVTYITNLQTSSDTVVYILDYDTGNYVKNQLYSSNGGMSRPSTILADAGDSYLVYYDTTHAVQTFYDRQGVVHTVDNNAYPQYALINKDDYYSNVPNYEVINDTLCDLG